MIASIRFLAFLALWCSALKCSLNGQTLDELKILRTWTTSSGSKVEASLVRADLSTVIFNVAGKDVPITYARLSSDDAKNLKRAYLQDANLKQLEQVKGYLPTLDSNTEVTEEALLKIHRDFPDSPFAGFFASVIISAEKNDFAKADKILSATIDRLKVQAEVLGKVNELTLCSAYNNLAVFSLKSKKGDPAAVGLARALKCSCEVPDAILQNSQQLLQAYEAKGAVIKLSKNSHRMLVDAIGNLKSGSASSGLKTGWYYSLAYNDTDGGRGAIHMEQVRDTWCLACGFDGIVDCANRDCQNGVIVGKHTVYAGKNPVNGASMYKEELTKTPCESCRGQGKRKCNECTNGRLR